MEKIYTDNHIWRCMSLLGCLLESSTPHNWHLHLALAAVNDPQSSWSRCCNRSSFLAQTIGLLVDLLIAMEANQILYPDGGVISAKVTSLFALVVTTPTHATNSIVRLVALPIVARPCRNLKRESTTLRFLPEPFGTYA